MAARPIQPKPKAGRRRAAKQPAKFKLQSVAILRSTLKTRSQAPCQGEEGGVDAWLEVKPKFADALDGIEPGDKLILITWLHKTVRDVLKVRRRRYKDGRIWGVFATRSPDRPNPLGLHPVTVKRRTGTRLRVGPIEAIDGTPVVDIKPVIAAPKKS